MSTALRTVFAGAALAIAAFGSAQAQDCPSEPMFAGMSGPNSDVRQSSRRIDQGDWRNAAHFASEALESGTSNRNKNAAAVNLCAALVRRPREHIGRGWLVAKFGIELSDAAVVACEDRYFIILGIKAEVAQGFARCAFCEGGEVQFRPGIEFD